MPLLISPIDGSPMRQINRYGIEIDVCPTSGGVWMDKHELEKLMLFLKEETMNEEAMSRRHVSQEHDVRKHYHDDDDRYEKRYVQHKKRDKVSRIMDIFDF